MSVSNKLTSLTSETGNTENIISRHKISNMYIVHKSGCKNLISSARPPVLFIFKCVYVHVCTFVRVRVGVYALGDLCKKVGLYGR